MTPKEKRQHRDLVRRYGITLVEYRALSRSQGHRCAICRTPPKPERALCVDHDHKTGTIRGLLCDHCNHALGKLADSAKRATALVMYLLKETV